VVTDIENSSGKKRGSVTCHRFALLDVLLTEQELPVQVGNVDGVKVQERDVSEAYKDNIFDCEATLESQDQRTSHTCHSVPVNEHTSGGQRLTELTAYSASPHKKNLGPW
jgi:hypothetical protein